MYKILIVDDREIFRRQFKRFKAFQNDRRFSVEFEAENGLAALEIMKKEPVDLVITDIRMSIMGGIELLKRIKAEDLCGCVVLLSEYTDFSYAKEGLVLGAFDYIVKPMNEQKLEDMLNRTAEYLDHLRQKQDGFQSEVRMLVPLMLKNDGYALSIGRQLANKVKDEKRDNLIDIYERLDEILGAVKKSILAQRPYLPQYSNMDKLFDIVGQSSLEGIVECFCGKIEVIMREVNKFNITAKNKMIKSICEEIVGKIEENITLQDIADANFVNKTYLSHIFKQETGMSFVDFITSVRLERARMLLSETDQKVYEIGSKLGYEDSEYFSRIFKNYFGVTPTLFRQRNAMDG